MVIVPVVMMVTLLLSGIPGAEARGQRGKREQGMVPAAHRATHSQRLRGLGRCTKLNITTHNRLNQRSLAPWTYVNCHDGNRYPPDIRVAVCTTTFCDGTMSTKRSVPIEHTVEVTYRKRQASSGSYATQLTHLRVAVGCTCIRD